MEPSVISADAHRRRATGEERLRVIRRTAPSIARRDANAVVKLMVPADLA
jgi:hypothetical protein